METNVILEGDCLSRLKELPNECVDAIVTDPPYGLEFMGKEWDKFTGSDTGIMAKPTSTLADKGFDSLPIFRGMDSEQINAFYKFNFEWAKECLRVLKPGGHLLAFGGSRTYHRLASGIEDAGFEIRDQIMWIYGSGFPKSLNIGKAIDKIQGNEREDLGEVKKLQFYGYEGNNVFGGDIDRDGKMKITKGTSEWEGWGTGLKPAHEPIVVARKPIAEKNVAMNVLKYSTGGINIDGSRIPSGTEHMRGNVGKKVTESDWKNNSGLGKEFTATDSPLGRFPANIILECTCDEKEHNTECPCGIMDSQSGNSNSNGGQSYSKTSEIYGEYSNDRTSKGCGFGDKGGASRYFQNIHTDENCPCRILNEQAPNTGAFAPVKRDKRDNNVYGDYEYFGDNGKSFREDFGGASRFFYCAKASKSERELGCSNLSPANENLQGLDTRGRTIEREDGSKTLVERWKPDAKRVNNHPTVKPIKLMEYLIKLVSREGSIILDPFLGSGTTAIASLKLNRQFIGIEKNKEYIEIANARIKPYLSQTKLPNLSV